MKVKHICIGNLYMDQTVVLRGVVQVMGKMFKRVECPICGKKFTVNDDGEIVN